MGLRGASRISRLYEVCGIRAATQGPGRRFRNRPVMNARTVWIVVFVSVAVVLLVVGGIAAFAVGLFKLLDNTDSHRCALSLVQNNQAAIGMLGQPIDQHGFTNGSSNDDNGKLTEHFTFTVAGPLGEATVEADGVRSQLESHLEVRFGRNQQSQTIYSGPLDCPALHERPAKP